MNDIFIVIMVIAISVAACTLIFLAVHLFIKAFEDGGRRTAIQGQSLTHLCDCDAGSGKTNRYYHAVSCRYRRTLEDNL
jgi:hypothetical protein